MSHLYVKQGKGDMGEGARSVLLPLVEAQSFCRIIMFRRLFEVKTTESGGVKRKREEADAEAYNKTVKSAFKFKGGGGLAKKSKKKKRRRKMQSLPLHWNQQN